MKRGRKETSISPSSSPFKVPKLTSSSTITAGDSYISLGDLGSSSLCEEQLSVFQPTSGASSWTGGRSQNQDCYYIDERYNSEDLVKLLKSTDHQTLRTMCTASSKSGQEVRNVNLSISAVFDGHGSFGEEAAFLAKENISKLIYSGAPVLCMREDHIKSTISVACSSTQDLLLEHARKKEDLKQEFGTTAGIAVLWGGNYLTVANSKCCNFVLDVEMSIYWSLFLVGDTRAVLYRKRRHGSYFGWNWRNGLF